MLLSFKKIFLSFLAVALVVYSDAQSLISGPWAGNVELRTAIICMEVAPTVKKVAVRYNPIYDAAKSKTINFKGALGKAFNPIKIEINGLDFNTTYLYKIMLDGKLVSLPFETQFTTKDLWEYRKPAPDFRFLTGS